MCKYLSQQELAGFFIKKRIGMNKVKIMCCNCLLDKDNNNDLNKYLMNLIKIKTKDIKNSNDLGI